MREMGNQVYVCHAGLDFHWLGCLSRAQSTLKVSLEFGPHYIRYAQRPGRGLVRGNSRCECQLPTDSGAARPSVLASALTPATPAVWETTAVVSAGGRRGSPVELSGGRAVARYSGNGANSASTSSSVKARPEAVPERTPATRACFLAWSSTIFSSTVPAEISL